jgi:HAD superfamily hydrolase (TIGR01509 family)
MTAEEVLTRPLSLQEVAARVGHEREEGGLVELEADLQAECASVRLRTGIAEIWQSLRERGLRIGVCSNLALPYGPPLLSALPDTPDTVILSYEVGLVKPDPAIFRLVCDRLGLQPAEVLFVGDTLSADIEAPRAIGMPAMHISDFETYTKRDVHKTGDLSEGVLAAIHNAEHGASPRHAPRKARKVHVIHGSGLGPLISLEEGKARLDEITVDDDSTDWAASELLGAAAMAVRLDVAVATLADWRDRGKAIAFRNEANDFVYPARQFDQSQPLEGLERVGGYFPSPEEAWEWLVTPNQYTDSTAPIDRLRSKHIEEVIRAAEGALDFQWGALKRLFVERGNSHLHANLDNLDPDPPTDPGHRIAQRIADDPYLMIPGRDEIVEQSVHVTVNPEPSFGKALRIEVVHEEGVESIASEVRMDRPRKWGVMRDDYVSLSLLQERELGQMQVVPLVDGRALDLHKIREASGLMSARVIEIGPERGNREPDPTNRDQVASVIREGAPIVVVVAVDVDDRQAEFILDPCKHLAPDLRIGMRVAGDHQDIGIDLTGKRETAIDLEHPWWCPEHRGILALVKMKIGDQRNLGQRSVLD